jgi:hypothetical protein
MSYNQNIASATEYGVVKVGSGLNVADGVISNSGVLVLNYGFFSNGTQTNPVANAVNLGTFTVTGPANGVSVVGGNTITVDNAGVYTVLFTTTMAKTSGGTSSMSIWLRYNGVDIPGSRQDLELINTLSIIFTSGNFTLNMAAGSNLQFCWSSADTTVNLSALPAGVTPTRPTGSSLKITMTKIS